MDQTSLSSPSMIEMKDEPTMRSKPFDTAHDLTTMLCHNCTSLNFFFRLYYFRVRRHLGLSLLKYRIACSTDSINLRSLQEARSYASCPSKSQRHRLYSRRVSRDCSLLVLHGRAIHLALPLGTSISADGYFWSYTRHLNFLAERSRRRRAKVRDGLLT